MEPAADHPWPRIRVALVQGVMAHYRRALFARLDRSDKLAVTFVSGGRDIVGVARLPDGAVTRHRVAPLHRLGPLVWQSGIVRLAWSREFDALILIGDPHYLSSWVAAALARLRRKPVLLWTHGWRRRDRGLKRLARLAFYRLGTALLLYGERGRQLGEAAGFPAERMAVVYNSLDLDRADAVIGAIERGEANGQPARALFADPSRPLLICTARLTRQLGIDLLLRAAARLSARDMPVNILLVGDGPMRGKLERLAQTLGVDVHFAGAVYDEEQLGLWLHDADLTVSPGKVGLTAIHSLSYGTPVITHGDLDEQMPEVEAITPGETGALFARGDEAALADTIAQWVLAGRDRAAIRACCRAAVRARWNAEAQAQIFERELVRVMSEAEARIGGPARPKVALVWDNFRPSHHDRAQALADAGYDVTGIELFGTSVDYRWDEALAGKNVLVTLAQERSSLGGLRLAVRVVRAALRGGARHVLMCHYERPAIFLAACLLRMRGRRLYTMLDSKFDDYERRWTRTLLKVVMLIPYRGALVASTRSKSYVSYLGVPGDRIAIGYNALDLARLRKAAGEAPLPAFPERPFIVVSRLLPKKNVAGALRAFATYRGGGGARRLVVIGDGPLAAELHAEAERLDVATAVDWLGAQPSEVVMSRLRGAVALLSPSIEEQFGHVVLEALAVGVPVIVSNNAGSVDQLVDNLVNGFVIDPFKPDELVAAMRELDGDAVRHARMARAALTASERGDVRHFVAAVDRLVSV